LGIDRLDGEKGGGEGKQTATNEGGEIQNNKTGRQTTEEDERWKVQKPRLLRLNEKPLEAESWRIRDGQSVSKKKLRGGEKKNHHPPFA